jgi:hypothetical protein
MVVSYWEIGSLVVERQQRIRFEDEDFYLDLVFHDFKLKCFLLVDLKLGKLTHQDVGQMDTYVRLYDERIRSGRQPDHQQPWTAKARRPLTEGPKDLTTTGRGPPESQRGSPKPEDTWSLQASVATRKFLNHLRPSFTFLPRWTISSQRPLRRTCSALHEGEIVADLQ